MNGKDSLFFVIRESLLHSTRDNLNKRRNITNFRFRLSLKAHQLPVVEVHFRKTRVSTLENTPKNAKLL
jgi:hypothetical protein